MNEMTHISLVSCSKTKSAHSAPAAALYESSLFRKSLLAALDASKQVYILSAKHGVLDLGEIIEPYDVTLKAMPSSEKIDWAQRTGDQLRTILKSGDTVSLYCGEEYSAPLREIIRSLGARIVEPLYHLSLGVRLRRLAQLNGESKLKADLKEFYKIMARLWRSQRGGRRFTEMTGKMDWPERGVYFIADAAQKIEQRSSVPRIIRVGTHAVSKGSRTTLWDRIGTHRGTQAGEGSHRSSIFRSHVGRTIIRTEAEAIWPDTWAVGQTAPIEIRANEKALERKVSSVIGAMRLAWLHVPDLPGPASDRAYIERNAIGLLSRAGLLSPTTVGPWLGKFSDDWRIATSGLWNLNHLFLNPDSSFLDVLNQYVDVTLGTAPLPQRSIAPESWYSQSETKSDQLSLFIDQN
ncbi:hypothetical protein JOE50_006851 [Bradyrhizobium japonicum]|nr:hypothetical protein [Bradyrhizobium japonicum]